MLTKPRPVPQQGTSMYTPKKRRFSPLLLIGISVPVLLVMIAGGVLAVQRFGAGAANPNMNCTLVVPPNPLTAQGLATPYQLMATNAANGPCNEANPNQSGFVQAAILDPATGAITAYEPLVVDAGTQPAITPVVPQLPANAVVGIWFGANSNIQTLVQNARTGGRGRHTNAQMGMRGGANGNCVNGTPGSPFGQFAYCNAINFFRAANRAIAAGKITVPALGTSTTDGQACPSTRSFTVVDMDQSDNVQTQYLVTANGQTAQVSAANKAQLPNATTIGNPSDNALISKFVDPALGCTAWMVPDMVNPGVMTATLATDELQAAAGQQAPIALVP